MRIPRSHRSDSDGSVAIRIVARHWSSSIVTVLLYTHPCASSVFNFSVVRCVSSRVSTCPAIMPGGGSQGMSDAMSTINRKLLND